MGDLNEMKLRKEWYGFFLCLGALFISAVVLLVQSRKQFHDQIIGSYHKLLRSELDALAEKTAFQLLERDLALFDLGLAEIATGSEELWEEILIEVLALPRVAQAYAYDRNGVSLPLAMRPPENADAIRFSSSHDFSEPFCKHREGRGFSFFFKVDALEDPRIIEVQVDEQFILREWAEVDKHLASLGSLSFASGVLLLFVIFLYLNRSIRDREFKLEERNSLLQRTNRKLAKVYKTVSLGALTGHLMHSLKTHLTQLQFIAGQADAKKNFDPSDLRTIHSQMRDLVNDSLLSLQEIEDRKNFYELSIGEIFEGVEKRASSVSSAGRLMIEDSEVLHEKLDNLHSALLTPILVSLVENAFQAKAGSIVRMKAVREERGIAIFVMDDSGGIPVTEREFIFDPSKSRKKGGTGLGLAIAKQLADCLAAELGLVESNASGSVFVIRLNNHGSSIV